MYLLCLCGEIYTEACPEKGPIEQYTLEPGQYDVVSKSKRTYSGSSWLWVGNWNLAAGTKYGTCFIAVQYPTELNQDDD